MQIKNMFEKQIDRDIKGVIKVGQSDEENVYQELDEYVVTKELLKHFRDFFNNYEKGVDGYTDKMGVWISGFFGSGKSHFLKILSYLLKNSTVEGKRAIEYFTDGKKIVDPMLIAEMTKAGTIESDVMLFNIDSKGSAKVGSGKEAIVEVFMKVFNEMQGYCGSIPYLAEFERQLDNEGRFEEFKENFEANAGAPWEKKRQAFAVIQDKVVKTLVEMNFMSEEAARNWCKNAKGNYDLSIEKFVSLVQEYCAKKGPNHHVIFLVDEIGQYIADDTQLMLNLQTIVEDLGTACKGKAWVIVTSQEDIDSITKTKGNDFSKIQGRFDTRLSLSASNVDEVIRKRVLAKNETATQTLRLLYEQKESIIKNLITFTADTADKKLYADKADFADCYPFIPYQFNLLGQVLTAVRTHGASGKHLSDQSRSMLALFQESAIRVMDKEDGVLVPFSFFYDPLHKFIDHQHSQVISDAENNSKLDEFDVELLKVLFMIKYVKEIKANVDNLTTLMISNIDDDRIEVRSKIEESLKKLIKETLVQKNGEIYIFLTNEEQEINNAINNESVEMGEIIGEASTVIFEEIYTEKKYRYSSRYLFPFNQKVDDRFFKGNQSNDIGVTVITPYGGDYADSALRLLSAQGSSVIVKLPNDSTFLDEITESIKIYKFLNKNASGARGSFDSIRRAKEDERIEKKDRIRIFIEDALKNADIYVNGDKATISAKEPATRINGLYSSFDKSKGNSGRIKIYWSKYNYSNYGDDYEFYSALADNISDEIAIREMTSEIVDYLNSNKFMLINNYQNKFGYWSYPQNGMWIYKDSLMFYSGDNEVINVNCCKKVCRGAIAHNAVKEIVFGATVTRFETKMITDCGQLEKITFEADVRCNFSELAILNCKELKCVNWPDIFDFEQISIYAECPKLGNMIRYNRLLTYQSNEKVIIVPPEIEVVNNKAFCSCKKAEIVIIPSGVERVEYEAFDETSISHVIIEGQYTQWDAHAQCDSVLYVYSKKDSNVMHSVSPFKKYPGLYMKNISCMEPYISDKYDTVGILSKCQNSCDGKSDDEMLVKPYSWEKEIYYKN